MVYEPDSWRVETILFVSVSLLDIPRLSHFYLLWDHKYTRF